MRGRGTQIDATSGYALEARGLRIRYDETEVVRGVDLTVLPGEIVSLLGPSGCGKTTILRAIAGFLVPDQGDIFWTAGVLPTCLHTGAMWVWFFRVMLSFPIYRCSTTWPMG